MSLSSVIRHGAAPGGVSVPGQDLGKPALSNGTGQSPLDPLTGIIRHCVQGITDLTSPAVHVRNLGATEIRQKVVVCH